MERITADRPDAAERWLDELVERVDLLGVSPDQGRQVPDVGRPEVREVIFGEYRVIYRRDAQGVVIVTIRHGRRAFDFSEIE